MPLEKTVILSAPEQPGATKSNKWRSFAALRMTNGNVQHAPMKSLFLFVSFALLAQFTHAQAVINLTTVRKSPERKAILDALRPTISKEAGVPVSFVVEHLKVRGSWAFMRGITKAASGGDVRWVRSPAYAELVKDGLFDGGNTAALLRKVKGRWTRVVHIIGPTDVAWTCWWKEYGAPRAVFDLAEDCGHARK